MLKNKGCKLSQRPKNYLKIQDELEEVHASIITREIMHFMLRNPLTNFVHWAPLGLGVAQINWYFNFFSMLCYSNGGST